MAANTKSKNAHTANAMSFKLPNNVITKDDITPLSKHKYKSKNKKSGNSGTSGSKTGSGSKDTGNNEEEQEPEIVDSIPTEMKQAYNSATEGSEHGSSEDNDKDGLFSPLGSPMEDDNEFSYFSDETENLTKFRSAAAPLTTGHVSKNDQHVSQTLMNMNALDFGGELNLPFGQDNDSHDDFWKEVKSTNEEAISLPDDDQLHTSSSFAYNSATASPKAPFESVSLNDFISDDLPSTREASHEWNEQLFRESSAKQPVRLLSYRDADGQLALRARNLSNTTKNARMCIINKRKNKHKKLLKRAIRRKSGVAQMISTDVGISELML